MQALGRHHVRPDQRHQRRQVGGAGPNPIGQRRSVKLDTLPRKGLALAVQRQVLAELRLQDSRQQLGSGTSARDRVERRRRLDYRLACPAAEPLAHGLDPLPAPRHHLQGLGDVLAELGQAAVAARTGGRTRDFHPLARKMRWQRPTHRLAADRTTASTFGRIWTENGLILGRRGLELLQLQLQLVQQLAAGYPPAEGLAFLVGGLMGGME